MRTSLVAVIASFIFGAPANAQSDRVSQRLAAIARLAETGDRSQTAFLARCIDDGHPSVRRSAIETIHELGIKSVPLVRRLMVLAQVDDDAGVRTAASRALRALAPRSHLAKVSSQNPPPVAPSPRPPLRPRARRAVLLPVGVAFNGQRPGETLGARLGLGLRWGDVESQLAVGLGAKSIGLQLRWLALRYPILTPYLTAGGVVSFNEGDKARRESASLVWGGGLRVYVIPPIYLQVEVVASYTVHDPLRGATAKYTSRFHRRWAIPVIIEFGLELWP